MSRWVSTPFTGIDAIPPKPGVYAIYNEGVLVYIGSSYDIRKRLRDHRRVVSATAPPESTKRTGLENCFPDKLRVKYRVCAKFGVWLSDEYRLIAKLQPPFNVLSASWKTYISQRLVGPATAFRQRSGHLCVCCGSRKPKRFMFNDGWCKICASLNPVASKAGAGTSNRFKRQTARPRSKTTRARRIVQYF